MTFSANFGNPKSYSSQMVGPIATKFGMRILFWQFGLFWPLFDELCPPKSMNCTRLSLHAFLQRIETTAIEYDILVAYGG